MSRARYYISFDNKSTYTEFFPSNEPVITWSREGEEIFMRSKVDKFKIARSKNSAVYDLIYNRFFDYDYFTTDINYKIVELGATTFEFVDPVIHGKIDTEMNVYEATPDPDDLYRDIMLKYNSKFTHLLAGSVFGINSTGYADQDLETNLFVNQAPPDDYTSWVNAGGGLVAWTNNGGGNARAWLTIAAVGPMDIICKISTFSGTAMILRGIDGGGTPVGADVTVNGVGTYIINVAGATYVEAFNNSLVLVTGTFTYNFFTIKNGDDIISGGSVYDCLDACINGASYMNLSYDIVSSLLWNDALPTGSATNTPNIDTYFSANPTNDYVIESAAIWNDLWLSWTDHYQTYHAFNAELSLKDIMDILRQKLRLFWYIDEDGKFRIEHEKYFKDYIVQLDLTTVPYTTRDKAETDRRQYTYNLDMLSRQITFNEANQSNEDWIPEPVIFDQTIISMDSSINVNAGSDFKYVHDYPDEASSGPLMLLRMIDGTSQFLLSIDASTKTATNFYMNALLGWYYILDNYHDHYASALTGYVNGAAHTFTNVKEFLVQQGVRFRMATALNWRMPFTLREGKGRLTTATYYPETGMYSIDVGYDPYQTVLYIVDSVDVTTSILADGGEYLTE